MRKSIGLGLASAFLVGLFAISMPAGAQTLRIGAHRALFGSWEIIADRMGYWKEEGLKYDVQSFKQGKLMRNAIIQGNLDVGTTGFGPYATAISKGAKVEAVGVTANICGLYSIWVRKDSKIKSFPELKGKIIATKKGTSVDFTVKEYIVPHYGFKVSDFKWLSVLSTQRVATLVSKQADAAIIGEPQAEIARQKGLVRKLEGFCPYDKTRMMHVANPNTLKAHPELFEKYFRGWLKAQKLLRDDPEKYARIYTKALNEIGDNTSYNVILPVVKRLRAQPYITSEVRNYLNDMADRQVKLGWIKSHPDFTKVKMLDDSELRQAAASEGIDVKAAVAAQ